MGRFKFEINSDYSENRVLADFIAELPVFFEKEGNYIYNKRNKIKKFVLSDIDDLQLQTLVVKRYKKPNFFQKLSYSFIRPTKAKRAFFNARKLRSLGISTPKEIAYIEEGGRSGFFEYGYYVCLEDNAPPIRERLIESEFFDRQMASDFAIFVAHLHEKGIIHKDLNSTNVLYHNSDCGYSFSLIDINRMDIYDGGCLPNEATCLANLCLFAGRMDLFEFVAEVYIHQRGWDKGVLQKAISIKIEHDRRWKRRKDFFKRFKF